MPLIEGKKLIQEFIDLYTNLEFFNSPRTTVQAPQPPSAHPSLVPFFFKLFDDFRGYVDFFLFQDLVQPNYSSINYFLPSNNFNNSPIPNDIHEYKVYRENMIKFINKRSERILEYSKNLS